MEKVLLIFIRMLRPWILWPFGNLLQAWWCGASADSAQHQLRAPSSGQVWRSVINLTGTTCGRTPWEMAAPGARCAVVWSHKYKRGDSLKSSYCFPLVSHYDYGYYHMTGQNSTLKCSVHVTYLSVTILHEWNKSLKVLGCYFQIVFTMYCM